MRAAPVSPDSVPRPELSPRDVAIDWRKDWRGPGQHSNIVMLPTIFEPAYSRDEAMFGQRERYAWAGEDIRWGANAHVFTTHVYRHPEYVAATLRHDPRSVFYPLRERRIRALRELRRIAESNRRARARFGRTDPMGWRSKANREATR
jgi:hypothetical protein